MEKGKGGVDKGGGKRGMFDEVFTDAIEHLAWGKKRGKKVDIVKEKKRKRGGKATTNCPYSRKKISLELHGRGIENTKEKKTGEKMPWSGS